MDEYQALRQQLLHRLAHLEGRLDKVEHDRRRGTNTLDPDWEEQATVRQNDEVLDESLHQIERNHRRCGIGQLTSRSHDAPAEREA